MSTKQKVHVRMEMHTLLLTLQLMSEFNLLLNIAFQDASGGSLSQETVWTNKVYLLSFKD